MRPLTQQETKMTCGVTLRRDPAREPCFKVAQLQTELEDHVGMTEISKRQRLHRHMHNEMQNLEITSQTLADFPETSWETRLQLARQCWDEARHTQLVRRRLEAHGGKKGDFPVMNYEWGTVCLMDSLAARLTLQNRTFEASEMDLFRTLIGSWTQAGDLETAAMLDGILADEVQHVRFANQWLKRVSKEDPKILMKVASAIGYLKKVTAALAPEAGATNAAGVELTTWTHVDVATNVEDRELAAFTPAEIAEVLRREGFGQLAANLLAEKAQP